MAFFYALDADLQGLKGQAREMGQPVTVGKRAIHRLKLGAHSIYAIKMGSGCVETAASAQALLSRFRCDLAFSLGPAGALRAELKTGQWYRVQQVFAWQRSHMGPADAARAETDQWQTDWRQLPAERLPLLFQANPPIILASGELFVASAGEREGIRAQTQADAVDMNGFGLALVCADHATSLFTWKIISDQADEDAATAFRGFVAEYQGAGGKMVAEIIQALPANPQDPNSYPAIEKLLRREP